MVNAAMVFMASLSRLVSKAILLEASAMAMLVRLSFCAIKFATYDGYSTSALNDYSKVRVDLQRSAGCEHGYVAFGLVQDSLS